MFEFNETHKKFFDASTGASSRISSGDETLKGQITCVGDEYDILIEHFGKDNILIGKVSSDRDKAEKNFLLDNSGEVIKLPLVFPKKGKDELRLYMRKREGFKPNDSYIWYIYKPNDFKGLLHIGYRPLSDWKQLTTVGYDEQLEIEDLGDEEYQKVLQTKLAKKLTKSTAEKYPRSASVAAEAVKKAHYKCQFDPSHVSFISASTGKPFVEVHHLIPMAKQPDFELSLDQAANVVALCPNCHRAIHHAAVDYKTKLVSLLFREQREPLEENGLGITLDELLDYYGIKEYQEPD